MYELTGKVAIVTGAAAGLGQAIAATFAKQGAKVVPTDRPGVSMDETIERCKKAGVVMTGAGAPYPYHNDPKDSNIRVAPSLPPVEELQQAMEVFCCCLKLAALEQLK